MKIAFGTDAAVYPHGQNAKEFVYMVEAGMPAAFALQAATRNAAELLKQSKDLGSIEAGKFADIIAVHGNPLDDIALMQKRGLRDERRRGGQAGRPRGRRMNAEWTGYVAATLTTLAFVPQAIKTIRSRDTQQHFAGHVRGVHHRPGVLAGVRHRPALVADDPVQYRHAGLVVDDPAR